MTVKITISVEFVFFLNYKNDCGSLSDSVLHLLLLEPLVIGVFILLSSVESESQFLMFILIEHRSVIQMIIFLILKRGSDLKMTCL